MAEAAPTSTAFIFPIKASSVPTLESQETEGGEPVFNYWREVAYPFHGKHSLTGQTLDFPESRIKHWFDTDKSMLAANFRIPFNDNHNVYSANAGLGNITDFKLDASGILYAKFRIVGEKNRDIFLNNAVSVTIDPEAKDSNGNVWHDAITSIAATQRGQLGGMSGAIAASAIPILLTSTGGPTMDGSIPCSATHLAGLKNHKHLNMSSIPDTGVVEHLHNYHQAMGQHLSAIARHVPGMDDCPAGTEMSAIANHVARHHTMMSAVKGFIPNSANLSATDLGNAVQGRITELSTAATTISTQAETIHRLEGEKTGLLKQVPEPVTKREASVMLSAMKDKARFITEKCGISPHVVQALIGLAGTAEQPNHLLLSAASNPSGNGVDGMLWRVLEVLATNSSTAGLGTELSAFQGVHHASPGSAINEETKALMAKMQEDAKKRAGVTA